MPSSVDFAGQFSAFETAGGTAPKRTELPRGMVKIDGSQEQASNRFDVSGRARQGKLSRVREFKKFRGKRSRRAGLPVVLNYLILRSQKLKEESRFTGIFS